MKIKNKTSKQRFFTLLFFAVSATLFFSGSRQASASDRASCEAGGQGVWTPRLVLPDYFGTCKCNSGVPNAKGFCGNATVTNFEQACITSGGTGIGTLGKCKGCELKGKVTGCGNGAVCQTKEDYDLCVAQQSPAEEAYRYSGQNIDPPVIAAKLDNYTLLESFPGFFNAGSNLTDLPALVLAIYKFGIWTVGIAGLFMLVVGGFMYMASAGNNSTLTNAKSIIWDALWGIVAAMGAYLILYVINPDLTKLNFSFTPVDVSEVDSMPLAGAVSSEGRFTDAVARQNLSRVNISVNKANCPNPQATNCTSLEGIPVVAISDLIALKNACAQFNPGCSFVVTGGTEAGHKSHGPGNSMIDIRQDSTVNSFLKELKTKQRYSDYGIGQICTVSAQDLNSISYNHSYSKTCQDPSSIDHFHFSFNAQ